MKKSYTAGFSSDDHIGAGWHTLTHNIPKKTERSEPAEACSTRGLDAASLFGVALGLGLALSQRFKQRLELQLLCREVGQLL
jgi:hypothetical protein